MRNSASRTALVTLVTTALLAGALVVGATAATVLPAAAQVNVPTSSYLTPEWGLVNVGVNRANGAAEESLVWDTAVIGRVLYVAGTFTDVEEPYGGPQHSRAYLAAFDTVTGDWLDWWAPRLDAAAYTLEVSPDGKLFVGGEFTTVNGSPVHAGVVKLDPSTGLVDSSFSAEVQRLWTADPMVVRDLHLADGFLYVGGNFNHVVHDGVRTRVYKAARLDPASGAVDTAWIPEITGRSVYAIAVSDDGVHIGGEFTSIGGATDSNLLRTVTKSTGALVTAWDGGLPRTPVTFWPEGGIIFGLGVYGDILYVAGAEHFWTAQDTATGDVIRFYSSAHDTQSVDIVDGTVYIGCHCRTTPQYWAYEIDAATAQISDSWTQHVTGSDGVWSTSVAPDGCVWVGGGLDSGLRAAGQRVAAHNLARFCPEGGPLPVDLPYPERPGAGDTTAPTTPGTPVVGGLSGGALSITWGPSVDDTAVAYYEVQVDGIPAGASSVPAASVNVPAGGPRSLTVVAVDVAGNRSPASAAVDVEVAGQRVNLAPGSAASQSSTYSNAAAGRAVDGDTNGRYGSGSVSHTDIESQPHWDLDLGALRAIEQVVLWNRTDCCASRLSDFHVFVSASPITTRTVAETQALPGVIDLRHAGPAGQTTTFDVPAEARYVRVQLEGRNHLQLAEVQVFGILPDTLVQGEPEPDTTPPAPPAGVQATVAADVVTVTWQPAVDDVGVREYLVFRDGAYVAWTAGTSWTDPSPLGTAIRSYTVRAVDMSDNRSEPSAAAVVSGAGTPQCSVTPNANGSVTVAWADLGANGYDVIDDTGRAVWITGATSWVDVVPNASYRVVGWGNGVGGASASCDNPGGGVAPFACTVTANGDGSVTVSWPDIGANGYDLSEGGGAPRWVRTTSVVDTTPSASYGVVAWGNGTSGTAGTCTN